MDLQEKVVTLEAAQSLTSDDDYNSLRNQPTIPSNVKLIMAKDAPRLAKQIETLPGTILRGSLRGRGQLRYRPLMQFFSVFVNLHGVYSNFESSWVHEKVRLRMRRGFFLEFGEQGLLLSP